MTNPIHRYGLAPRFLHWLTVILVLVAWTLGTFGDDLPKGAARDTGLFVHISAGLLILMALVVRLAWRVTHGEPEPDAGMPPWQTTSARIVHWLLYALLFVLPVLGWINASWRGMPIVMFGLELPQLVATRAAGWDWTGDVHALLANYLLLTLVGLHVLAALYHYFIRRDGVLQRMLPGD